MTTTQAGMMGFVPKVLIQPIETKLMTVGGLTTLLDGIDSDVWVCIDGKGAAVQLKFELGANEPFVSLG